RTRPQPVPQRAPGHSLDPRPGARPGESLAEGAGEVRPAAHGKGAPAPRRPQPPGPPEPSHPPRPARLGPRWRTRGLGNSPARRARHVRHPPDLSPRVAMSSRRITTLKPRCSRCQRVFFTATTRPDGTLTVTIPDYGLPMAVVDPQKLMYLLTCTKCGNRELH